MQEGEDEQDRSNLFEKQASTPVGSDCCDGCQRGRREDRGSITRRRGTRASGYKYSVLLSPRSNDWSWRGKAQGFSGDQAGQRDHRGEGALASNHYSGSLAAI